MTTRRRKTESANGGWRICTGSSGSHSRPSSSRSRSSHFRGKPARFTNGRLLGNFQHGRSRHSVEGGLAPERFEKLGRLALAVHTEGSARERLEGGSSFHLAVETDETQGTVVAR